MEIINYNGLDLILNPEEVKNINLKQSQISHVKLFKHANGEVTRVIEISHDEIQTIVYESTEKLLFDKLCEYKTIKVDKEDVISLPLQSIILQIPTIKVIEGVNINRIIRKALKKVLEEHD